MLWIALVLAVFNGLVVCYYWLLPILSSWRHTAPESAALDHPTQRFALVVPAHDEEATIRQSLESHAQLDYPPGLYEVFVVADNCSDHTADLARDAGATCLERQDLRDRGKGHALGWAFQQILPRDFDALMVVDADCTMDPHTLRLLDRELRRGARVLQLRYAVSNPDASPISYATAVGNLIENDLFYGPKSRLGLSVFLRGTGMVFHRGILESHPWEVGSNTEDMDYALELIGAGIPIRFVPEASVWSDFPVEARQLQVQRRRWASGSGGRAGIGSLRLIARGLARRNAAIADAGWTLTLLSRPLVVLSILAGLAVAAQALRWGRGPLPLAVFTASCCNALALAAYLAAGVLMLGLTRPRVRMLLGAPWVVAQLTWATLLGAAGVDRGIWRRTPRGSAPGGSAVELGAGQAPGPPP